MADMLPNPSFPAPEDPHQARSVVVIVDEQVARSQRHLTDLGKRLLESRRRIEDSGVPLLNRQQLDCERAERRGGVPNQ
jgi:hypothetical protein